MTDSATPEHPPNFIPVGSAETSKTTSASGEPVPLLSASAFPAGGLDSHESSGRDLVPVSLEPDPSSGAKRPTDTPDGSRGSHESKGSEGPSPSPDREDKDYTLMDWFRDTWQYVHDLRFEIPTAKALWIWLVEGEDISRRDRLVFALSPEHEAIQFKHSPIFSFFDRIPPLSKKAWYTVVVALYAVLHGILVNYLDIAQKVGWPFTILWILLVAIPMLLFLFVNIEQELFWILVKKWEWKFLMLNITGMSLMLIGVYDPEHIIRDITHEIIIFIANLLAISSDASPGISRAVKFLILSLLVANCFKIFSISFLSNPLHEHAASKRVCIQGESLCFYYIRIRLATALNILIFYLKYMFYTLVRPGRVLIIDVHMVLRKTMGSSGQVARTTIPDSDEGSKESIPLDGALECEKNVGDDRKSLGSFGSIGKEKNQKYLARMHGEKNVKVMKKKIFFMRPALPRRRLPYIPLSKLVTAAELISHRIIGFFVGFLTVLLIISISTYVIEGPYLLILTIPILLYGFAILPQLDRILLLNLCARFSFWFLVCNAIIRSITGPINNNLVGGAIANDFRNVCAYSTYLLFNFIAITFDANPFITDAVKRGALLLMFLENLRVLFSLQDNDASKRSFWFFYWTDSRTLENTCVVNLALYSLKMFVFSFRKRGKCILIRSPLKVNVYSKDDVTKKPKKGRV